MPNPCCRVNTLTALARSPPRLILTGFFETVYDVFLPEGGQSSLEQGLRVMRDYAEGALILESEIEKERRVILSEAKP